MFIFIKVSSAHKGNLKTERIGNSGKNFFRMPFWVSSCMLTPRWRKVHVMITLLRNHEPNLVSEMSHSCLQHMLPFSFRETKMFNLLLFRVLLHNCFRARYFVTLTKIFGAWQKHAKTFFSPKRYNNLHQAFHIK